MIVTRAKLRSEPGYVSFGRCSLYMRPWFTNRSRLELVSGLLRNVGEVIVLEKMQPMPVKSVIKALRFRLTAQNGIKKAMY